MPHATPPRSRSRIKIDPDLQTSPTLPRTQNSSDQSQAGSASSTHIPVDQAFYRTSRSDAPAPSDRHTDFEPLLVEMRHRPLPSLNMASDSTISPEDSFSFHNSFSDISKRLKACNDTLGELQQLGVSHDVQLPELVLVGDQSAGKSSLMSGLAGLDLPRSEGTCTRCPLHIRVSRNAEWSCRVSIRKEYKYQPPRDGQIKEEDVTSAHPFFPWKKLPTSISYEFKTLQDKSHIEETLRWAQIATLNDNLSIEQFVPGSGSIAMSELTSEATTEAKFSPNVVALEIKGPALPDLSFYDLPGMFQNTPNSQDIYLVKVVRNLSEDYIQHPSAIIMCAMPMNSDAETSGTWGMISRRDAKRRTIGVLTKADLLPDNSNSHTQWRAILNQEAHQTGLGYFVTSRPHDQDLESLKKWEENMFITKTAGKWPEALTGFEDRCGVEKLLQFLSHKLGEEFARSLPYIKCKVEDKWRETKEVLDTLPGLPDKVEVAVHRNLSDFSIEAYRAIDEFCSTFNEEPQNFKNCLQAIKPKFIMRDASDAPVVEISDDEEDEEESQPTETPSRRRAAPSLGSTPKRQRTTPASANPSFGNSVKREDATPQPSPRKNAGRLKPPYDGFSSPTNVPRTLRDMSREVAQKMGPGIPDHIPASVFEGIVLKSIEPWKGPLKVFLDQSINILQARLLVALDKSLCEFKKRLIFTESQAIISRFLAQKKENFLEFLLMLYRKEAGKMYTLNDKTFVDYREDALLELRRFRLHHRMLAQSLGSAKGQFIPWEDLDDNQRAEDRKERERNLAKIGKDKFDREVMVMGYIRGYYQLAALRFADDVAQSILCILIPDLRRELTGYLVECLGVQGRTEGVEVYERLMEEDAAIAGRRRNWKLDLKKFEKALKSIESLQTGGVHVQLDQEPSGEDVVMANGDNEEEQEDDQC